MAALLEASLLAASASKAAPSNREADDMLRTRAATVCIDHSCIQTYPSYHIHTYIHTFIHSYVATK